MEFSRQEYWSGLAFPSLGDFLTQGLNTGLPHCRQIHYCLSHQWKRTDFIFLGSQITVNGDCSHEFKRHSLLERKARTNQDRVLKRKEITLPTKFHVVKAIAFPVVMYGCPRCIKERPSVRELMLSSCGAGEDS